MYDDPRDIDALTGVFQSTHGDSAYEKRDCIRPVLLGRWWWTITDERFTHSPRGQPSPGSISHVGQQPSYGSRHMSQTSTSSSPLFLVLLRHRTIARHDLILTFIGCSTDSVEDEKREVTLE